ncbi:hypothetical protein FF011L_44300 [Roseimaritima multifibrata]|uniref:Uncharacterized protein n=1 Tax=Roseimaritima multifibrata TaxID=1930274 RepID=A0A517ML77_9BACT|nr:hypothetical protein FF011L_44300 [Roseimaritima multifibrata]
MPREESTENSTPMTIAIQKETIPPTMTRLRREKKESYSVRKVGSGRPGRKLSIESMVTVA